MRRHLPTDRNPFVVTGTWSPETLKEVDIQCPSLTSSDETTNELTRANKPEARYWKSPIKFSASSGNWTSTTLRFNNVPIPYRESKGYGTSFVYLCLPGFVASAFAAAGKKVRPTVVYEPSLVPDGERWWKVVNNVSGNFGAVVRTGAGTEFVPKPLDTRSSGKEKLGVTANVELRPQDHPRLRADESGLSGKSMQRHPDEVQWTCGRHRERWKSWNPVAHGSPWKQPRLIQTRTSFPPNGYSRTRQKY